jgi:hypothetical protein
MAELKGHIRIGSLLSSPGFKGECEEHTCSTQYKYQMTMTASSSAAQFKCPANVTLETIPNRQHFPTHLLCRVLQCTVWFAGNVCSTAVMGVRLYRRPAFFTEQAYA